MKKWPFDISVFKDGERLLTGSVFSSSTEDKSSSDVLKKRLAARLQYHALVDLIQAANLYEHKRKVPKT